MQHVPAAACARDSCLPCRGQGSISRSFKNNCATSQLLHLEEEEVGHICYVNSVVKTIFCHQLEFRGSFCSFSSLWQRHSTDRKAAKPSLLFFIYDSGQSAAPFSGSYQQTAALWFSFSQHSTVTSNQDTPVPLSLVRHQHQVRNGNGPKMDLTWYLFLTQLKRINWARVEELEVCSLSLHFPLHSPLLWHEHFLSGQTVLPSHHNTENTTISIQYRMVTKYNYPVLKFNSKRGGERKKNHLSSSYKTIQHCYCRICLQFSSRFYF